MFQHSCTLALTDLYRAVRVAALLAKQNSVDEAIQAIVAAAKKQHEQDTAAVCV
jgi:hypothetical protein